MKILVTGCVGFIGYHLCCKLSNNNKNKVYGIDNLNSYYDISLKKDRLQNLKKNQNFFFKKIDIKNNKELSKYFEKHKFNYVVHLAAQAGVRFSIKNPRTYMSNNILGFFNILENARLTKVKHLLTASTSSVYGNNKSYPLKESFPTEKPLSFYAASKKTNEVMAYSYSNIYNLPITVLRFFTVYGNYGRPDMSLFKFTKNIIHSKKIDLFNKGNHERDFTHVDDVVSNICNLVNRPPTDSVPYEVYNIASGKPKKLMYFLKIIENNLKKNASLNMKELQKGDVIKTHASTNKIISKTGIKKRKSFEKGIKSFVNWYKKYYS